MKPNRQLLVLLFLCCFGHLFGQTSHKGIIYFNTDKHNIDKQSAATLDEISDLMQRYPGGVLEVSGHTDDVGSNGYNDALSERRVQSALGYLKAKNGSLPEVKEAARGEIEPAASNETSKQLNRRVELIYKYTEPIKEVVKTTKESIKTLYDQLMPKSEKHCIDNSKDTFLLLSKGTVIHLTANAFTRQPSGCVTISAREATSKSDMILQNLSTMGSEGMLVTGGMIDLRVSDSKGELRLKEDKSRYTIFFKTDSILPQASTYYGARDTTYQHTMRWGYPGDRSFYSLPFDYWVYCWQQPTSACGDRCRFFCRLGRFDQAMKGMTNYDVRQDNRQFRSCQRSLRKSGRRNRNAVASVNVNCSSYFSQFAGSKGGGFEGPTFDTSAFLAFYGNFMKEQGLTTVEETLEAIKKIQEEKRKTAEFSANALTPLKMGPINCDFFPGKLPAEQLTNLDTKLPRNPNIDCKLIFENYNSVMTSYGNEMDFVFQNVPKKEQAWLLALKVENDEPYIFLQKIKIGDKLPEIVFEKVTIEELKERLKILDAKA